MLEVLRYYVEFDESTNCWVVKTPFGRPIFESDSQEQAKEVCVSEQGKIGRKPWYCNIHRWLNAGELERNELEALMWIMRLSESGVAKATEQGADVRLALACFGETRDLPEVIRQHVQRLRRESGSDLNDAIREMKQLYYGH